MNDGLLGFSSAPGKPVNALEAGQRNAEMKVVNHPKAEGKDSCEEFDRDFIGIRISHDHFLLWENHISLYRTSTFIGVGEAAQEFPDREISDEIGELS